MKLGEIPLIFQEMLTEYIRPRMSMTQSGTRGKRKNMPKKQVQWRRAAATGIASCRVWAKILEFVVGRSITTNSLDWDGILVTKESYIQERCPDYWTLGLHRHQDAFDRLITLYRAHQ